MVQKPYLGEMRDAGKFGEASEPLAGYRGTRGMCGRPKITFKKCYVATVAPFDRSQWFFEIFE